MKNKKGFTLIELLCVIAILAVVTTIASASVVNLSNKSKNNLYCAKLEMIESAAKGYAINHEYELNKSASFYEGYKSLKITVNDLVENGNLSLPLEEEGFPYCFLLSSDMTILHAFIPDKAVPDLANNYLKNISQRYFQTN